MKRDLLICVAVVSGQTVTASTLSAHHCFAAQYDVNNRTTIEASPGQPEGEHWPEIMRLSSLPAR